MGLAIGFPGRLRHSQWARNSYSQIHARAGHGRRASSVCQRPLRSMTYGLIGLSLNGDRARVGAGRLQGRRGDGYLQRVRYTGQINKVRQGNGILIKQETTAGGSNPSHRSSRTLGKRGEGSCRSSNRTATWSRHQKQQTTECCPTLHPSVRQLQSRRSRTDKC